MSEGAGQRDPATLLADVPPQLWGDLLRALRRAMEHMARSELPRGLQPFAGWRPDKLAQDRPRAAAGEALAADSALRELVGEALDDRAAYEAAREGDARRIAAEHGEQAAIAALVARGRWDAVAVVAGEASERRATRDRVSAEEARRRRTKDTEAQRRRLLGSLSEAREERDAHRRRAQAADERRRRTAEELSRVKAELSSTRARSAELEAELDEERRRNESRETRLRRRLEEAEARARIDEGQAHAVLADLEALSARLRGALAPPAAEPTGSAESTEAGEAEPVTPPVPRDVAPAAVGRPCRLPDGVSQDSPLGVRSLLKVPGLEVLLDGYNVSKDARGQPGLALEQQRQWLVRSSSGVSARTRCRHTIVFDGSEVRPAPVPSARGVRVVYTSGDETADDRLVALVENLPAEQPVLVVSSDREVRDACARLGANTTTSGAYLAAVGA